MIFTQRIPLLFGVVMSTFAMSAAAQFQAAHPTARRTSINVRENESGVPSAPNFLTVNGPPGATFAVFIEFGPAADSAFSNVLNGMVIEPICLNETGVVFHIDPTLSPSANGVLPASGTLTLNTGAVINEVPPGVFFNWQAVTLDSESSSGVSFSNCVYRQTVNPVARPSTSGYAVQFFPVSGEDFTDYEEADVDGDGDLDVLLVPCSGGDLKLFLMENRQLSPVPITISVPTATSAEFADVNNDNYLDLLVSTTNGSGLTVIGNRGRFVQSMAGFDALGPWLGFGAPGTVIPDFTIPTPARANDLDTADIDGDGRIDVMLACGGNPQQGVQNRVYINNSVIGGAVLFEDLTAGLLTPYPFLDDSEDVEFADLDGDGDMDAIVANFDGPTSVTGEDFVYVNAGGLQNGPQGAFSRTAISGINDESLDVAVGDVNNDGLPDLYFCNWYGTTGNFGGPPWSAAVPDRLYINTTTGANIAFADQSSALPDNPAFLGGTPLLAEPSTDAEIVDYDLDGDLDIFVGIGRKCVIAAPLASGLRLVGNRFIENSGVISFVLDPSGALPPSVQGIEHSDLEFGDRQFLWHDRDYGAATAVGSGSGGVYFGLKIQ